MKDRIPKHPGRIKLTPVAGDIYDLERADEPEQEGTPINKATLLTDETAKLLEIKKENPTPNDAFEHIAKNAVGDEGMNINLLEGLGNMKYCKVLTTESLPDLESSWLYDGVAKYVLKREGSGYTLLLKMVENSSQGYIRLIRDNGTIVDSFVDLGERAFPIEYTPNGTSIDYNCYYFLHAIPTGKYVVLYFYHNYYYYNSGNAYNRFSIAKIFLYDTSTDVVTLMPADAPSSSFNEVIARYVRNRGSMEAYYNATYNGIYFNDAINTNAGIQIRMRFYNIATKAVSTIIVSGGHRHACTFKFIDDSSFIASLYEAASGFVSAQYRLCRYNLTAATTATAATLFSQTKFDGNDDYRTMMRKNANNSVDLYVNGPRWTSDITVGQKMITGITKSTTTVTEADFKDLNGVVSENVLVFNPSAILTYVNLTDTTSVVYNVMTGKYTKTIGITDEYSIIRSGTALSNRGIWLSSDASQAFSDTGTNTLLVVDKYGNYSEIEIDLQRYEEKVWACPEDGIYKFVLVGGGAAGGVTYGGGSGYLKVIARSCVKGEKIPYMIGRGGSFSIESIPDMAQPLLVATPTILEGEFALGGVANIGGANGHPDTGGGGGGGYDLVNYGGGGGYSTVLARLNGGQGSQPATGYGAGGSSKANGRDGCIVVIR